MKNFLTLLACFFFYTVKAQTLFTYGAHQVSKEEFQNAFLKNKPENSNDQQALKDYLDLYIRFKLKVQAAYDLKMDTLANQKADIETYRHQIENSFLTDSTSFRNLVDEAFARSQKDIRLSYILVPFTDHGKDDSEGSVQKKANDIIQQLKSGTSFESLAASQSADTAAKRTGGDLGYITLFTLPYPLENIAYALQTGEVSTPVKTKAGYVIFKKTNERKAVGKIRIAQILIAMDPGSVADERLGKKKLTDSVYKAALAGASFDSLAIKYSNDQASFANGGSMPEFGVGVYDPVFESNAFSIQKDGEILPPFETAFGFHILKRISCAPVVSDRSAAENFLASAVTEDNRNRMALQVLEKKMVAEVAIKTEKFDEKQLWRITEEFISKEQYTVTPGFSDNKILLRLPKRNVTLIEWLRYARTWSLANEESRNLPELMSSFRNFTAINYYRSHLEDFNPIFKKQLKEFADGNMLFEVMENEVWNKAAADTKGLRNYYQQHKDKYLWEASAAALMFTAADESLAEKTIAQLKTNPSSWKQLSETSEGRLVADSGRFELSQLTTATSVKKGTFTPVLKNDIDETVTFSYIIDVFPAGSSRNFDDARGIVISDYQQVIEDQWIAALKKKYPVVVQQQVWREVLR